MEETIRSIVKGLLRNVKETAKDKKINNIVYHESWYEKDR